MLRFVCGIGIDINRKGLMRDKFDCVFVWIGGIIMEIERDDGGF